MARNPDRPALWQIDEAKWLVGTSKFKLLASQRKLLAELAGAPYSERSPESLKEDPGYFLKHGQRLSLNLSPLSMPSRAQAQESWGAPGIAARLKRIRLEDSASHTFKDWTGFPTYCEFFAFCAQERHTIFKAAREHFTPALIYCGGPTSLDDYRRAWAETDTTFATASFLYRERKIPLHFAWLPNAPEESRKVSDKPARPEDTPRNRALLLESLRARVAGRAAKRGEHHPGDRARALRRRRDENDRLGRTRWQRSCQQALTHAKES